MRVLKPNEGKGGQVVDSGEGVLCEYVHRIPYFVDTDTDKTGQHPSQRH
jgi:hypothetical protein